MYVVFLEAREARVRLRRAAPSDDGGASCYAGQPALAATLKQHVGIFPEIFPSLLFGMRSQLGIPLFLSPHTWQRLLSQSTALVSKNSSQCSAWTFAMTTRYCGRIAWPRKPSLEILILRSLIQSEPQTCNNKHKTGNVWFPNSDHT
jgi:hypothetical protein